MASTIVTRAPTRIDFGGGWTDVPPYSSEAGGFVCNLAITRYATVTLERGHDSAVSADTSVGDRGIVIAAARRFRAEDVRVNVASDFPIGAGLGGSSAVGVAPLPVGIDGKALKRRLYDEYRVEAPITSWDEKPFIRVSFQGYNTRDDLEVLMTALENLLREMTPA